MKNAWASRLLIQSFLRIISMNIDGSCTRSGRFSGAWLSKDWHCACKALQAARKVLLPRITCWTPPLPPPWVLSSLVSSLPPWWPAPLLHSFNWVSTHTHQAPQVRLLVVWCTTGGGGPHVLTLLEHNYCMLERQLGVIIIKKEVEQTTSVYQSSHSTLPSLLGHRVDEHTCMELSIRLQVVIMAHFTLSMTTMFHVQCATLQHEEQLWWFLHNSPALHPGPESTMDTSWRRGLAIIAPCLSVWTILHSQYLAMQ